MLSWIKAHIVNPLELNTGRDITRCPVWRCYADDASTLCRGSCHCLGEVLAADTPTGANSGLFQQLVHWEQKDKLVSETGSHRKIQLRRSSKCSLLPFMLHQSCSVTQLMLMLMHLCKTRITFCGLTFAFLMAALKPINCFANNYTNECNHPPCRPPHYFCTFAKTKLRHGWHETAWPVSMMGHDFEKQP